MPLKKGTSKETREKNIRTEMKKGRPPKQAEAIGYAVQDRAKVVKLKKKLKKHK